MKIVLVCIFIILGLGACAQKSDTSFYERANNANDRAVSDLEK